LAITLDELPILWFNLGWVFAGEDAPNLVYGHGDPLHGCGRRHRFCLEISPKTTNPAPRQDTTIV
jgi:hypothetical protein